MNMPGVSPDTAQAQVERSVARVKLNRTKCVAPEARIWVTSLFMSITYFAVICGMVSGCAFGLACRADQKSHKPELAMMASRSVSAPGASSGMPRVAPIFVEIPGGMYLQECSRDSGGNANSIVGEREET